MIFYILMITVTVVITIIILLYSPVWLIDTRGRLRRRRRRRRWQPRRYRRWVDSRSDDDPAAAAAAAAAATTVVADAIRCCVWQRWWCLWRARPGQLMTLSRRSTYYCPSRRLRCNILYILYNKIYMCGAPSRKGPPPPPPGSIVRRGAPQVLLLNAASCPSFGGGSSSGVTPSSVPTVNPSYVSHPSTAPTHVASGSPGGTQSSRSMPRRPSWRRRRRWPFARAKIDSSSAAAAAATGTHKRIALYVMYDIIIIFYVVQPLHDDNIFYNFTFIIYARVIVKRLPYTKYGARARFPRRTTWTPHIIHDMRTTLFHVICSM